MPVPAGMPATVEPGAPKFGVVVPHHEVVAEDHVDRGLDRQPRRDERQQTARVVVHVVVLDDGVATVLDLDAGDAFEHVVVRDVDVVAHADIDRGVGDPRYDVVLDDAVLAELREDAVHAGVHNHVVADLEVVAGLPHDPVALVVADLEVLGDEVVARVEDRVVELLLAVEHRAAALLDDADDADVVLVDVHGLVIRARHHADDGSLRRRLDRRLDRLAVLHDHDVRRRRTGHRSDRACGCRGARALALGLEPAAVAGPRRGRADHEVLFGAAAQVRPGAERQRRREQSQDEAFLHRHSPRFSGVRPDGTCAGVSGRKVSSVKAPKKSTIRSISASVSFGSEMCQCK